MTIKADGNAPPGRVNADTSFVTRCRPSAPSSCRSTPQVLDVVECLAGPDIALWSSHFIGKDARVGRATPWHKDSLYWQGRIDRYGKIITVWLALDDSTGENGCTQVGPGSHL